MLSESVHMHHVSRTKSELYIMRAQLHALQDDHPYQHGSAGKECISSGHRRKVGKIGDDLPIITTAFITCQILTYSFTFLRLFVSLDNICDALSSTRALL